MGPAPNYIYKISPLVRCFCSLLVRVSPAKGFRQCFWGKAQRDLDPERPGSPDKPPREGQGKRLQQQSCFWGLLHLQHNGEGHEGEINSCGEGPVGCMEDD